MIGWKDFAACLIMGICALVIMAAIAVTLAHIYKNWGIF